METTTTARLYREDVDTYEQHSMLNHSDPDKYRRESDAYIEAVFTDVDQRSLTAEFKAAEIQAANTGTSQIGWNVWREHMLEPYALDAGTKVRVSLEPYNSAGPGSYVDVRFNGALATVPRSFGIHSLEAVEVEIQSERDGTLTNYIHRDCLTIVPVVTIGDVAPVTIVEPAVDEVTAEINEMTAGVPVPDAKLAKLRALVERAATAERMQAAAESEVHELKRQLVNAESGPITNTADPRLTPIWDRAHEAADEAGYCGVFDELMDTIGAPTRERDYTVDLDITMTVSVPVTARPADVESNGSSEFSNNIDGSDVDEAIRNYLYIENANWDVIDWSEA